MIINSTVIIKWNVNNKEHLESFGYIYTKINQEIEIKIEHIKKSSKVKIEAQCEECLEIRTISYCDYSKYCRKCCTKLLHEDPVFRQKNIDSMNYVNEKYKEKIRETTKSRLGPLHPNWNPNKTREQRQKDRKTLEHTEWAKSVKVRDGYLCQICFVNSNQLVSHHLMAYASYPELRLDLDNGVTLCRKCHNKFHKIYGKGENTKEQFEEFKESELENERK